MISIEAAQKFAAEWIAVWNRHDLDAIMAHYADDVEFWSPMIVKLMGDPAGTLKGKAQVRAYFAKGLMPGSPLHFTLIEVLLGVESVTITFRRHDGARAAEVMTLDAEGRVTSVRAHYSLDSAVWQP